MTNSETGPTRTTVIRPAFVMASSYALTLDILDTANRVADGSDLPRPFDVCVQTADSTPEMPGPCDLMILPGLGLSSRDLLDAAMASPEMRNITQVLTRLSYPHTVFASSCTGVFALGQAGLIAGRQVTTTWWLAPALKERFPDIRLCAGDLVVDDGHVVTAGAALAHIDLMLHLVERFAGMAVADAVRRFLVIDDRRSQTPYTSVAMLVATDPVLRQAEQFIRQNLASPLTIDAIAAHCGQGARTFARRLARVAVMTPVQFLQTIRVTHAIRLARSTRHPNDEIAIRVGYSDATALRRVVKQLTGRTLEAFRAA